MDNYHLQWRDFETNIKQSFKELREEQLHFDVTLACDDHQLSAHKIVLSTGSKFFKDIFKNSTHSNPFIYLKGVKGAQLEALVEFMYNGETSIAQKDLSKFLSNAQELDVKGLQNSDNKKPETSKQLSIEETVRHVINVDEKSMKGEKSMNCVSGAPSIIDPLQQHQNDNSIEPISESFNYDNSIIEEDDPDGSFEVLADPFGFRNSIGKADENYVMHDDTMDLDLQIEQLLERKDGLWRCTICGKEARLKGNMKMHAETHIRGLSHICQTCSKSFSTRSSLKNHCYKAHSVGNNKSFGDVYTNAFA